MLHNIFPTVCAERERKWGQYNIRDFKAAVTNFWMAKLFESHRTSTLSLSWKYSEAEKTVMHNVAQALQFFECRWGTGLANDIYPKQWVSWCCSKGSYQRQSFLFSKALELHFSQIWKSAFQLFDLWSVLLKDCCAFDLYACVTLYYLSQGD